MSETAKEDRVAWKVTTWAHDTDLSKSYIYELIKKGEIETIKFKGARLIVTSPAEFVAREKAKSAESEPEVPPDQPATPIDVAKFTAESR